MRYLKTILICTALMGCAGEQKEKKPVSTDTALVAPVTPDTGSKNVSTGDTSEITVRLKGNDSIHYTNAELTKILSVNPELNEKYPVPPDAAYLKSEGFESEAGADDYYVLYAYFLKQNNGEKKYETKRRRLTELFSTINSVYQQLSGGGTYYGHMFARIPGYVEYAIYTQTGNDHYEKKYDIRKQKDLYIASLIQFIRDEINADES